MNDRNDLPDDHEESEYHFSDEDVNYEVETESSKPAQTQPKESLLQRASQSKRMIISLGVFLVLVFIVYKMVTPNTGTVATDLTVPTTAQNSAPAGQIAQSAPTAQPAPQQPVAATPTQPEMPAPSVEVAVTPPPAPAPQQTAPVEPSVAPPVAQATPAPTPAPQEVVANMPPVIAVQQPAPQAGPQAVPPSPQSTVVTTVTKTDMPAPPTAPTGGVLSSGNAAVDNAIINMTAANERLMAQLQTDYTQKINDYAVQNKVIQDQMQALNSRVTTMEAQLSQLVNALTQQHSSSVAPPPPGVGPSSMTRPERETIRISEPKVNMTVQAIIPGRAWLRSDSGEAITVAEGDMIKELGKVTKIDPYDGVVEVNTGNKTIAISYGNGSE